MTYAFSKLPQIHPRFLDHLSRDLKIYAWGSRSSGRAHFVDREDRYLHEVCNSGTLAHVYVDIFGVEVNGLWD